MLRYFVCFLLLTYFYGNLIQPVAWAECKAHEERAQTEGDLSPLDILILDLQSAKELIEKNDNKTAIIILKSSLKYVRKVKEFDAETKRITTARIKKGINLLKKNKNAEALALIETGFDALEEAGLLPAGS